MIWGQWPAWQASEGEGKGKDERAKRGRIGRGRIAIGDASLLSPVPILTSLPFYGLPRRLWGQRKPYVSWHLFAVPTFMLWDHTRSRNVKFYYMASSVSGQDELNRALWLATRAGKMEPSCPLGTTRCIPQAKFHQKPYNKSFTDRSFFASLWTSTSSRSINTQKKNLANIQPSWPHTWSITHTNSLYSIKG